jgi:hypothetical protein
VPAVAEAIDVSSNLSPRYSLDKLLTSAAKVDSVEHLVTSMQQAWFGRETRGRKARLSITCEGEKQEVRDEVAATVFRLS